MCCECRHMHTSAHVWGMREQLSGASSFLAPWWARTSLAFVCSPGYLPYWASQWFCLPFHFTHSRSVRITEVATSGLLPGTSGTWTQVCTASTLPAGSSQGSLPRKLYSRLAEEPALYSPEARVLSLVFNKNLWDPSTNRHIVLTGLSPSVSHSLGMEGGFSTILPLMMLRKNGSVRSQWIPLLAGPCLPCRQTLSARTVLHR